VTEPSPRTRILAECTRLGRSEVVARCVRLLEGGDVDDAFIRVLAGRTAPWWFAHREDEDLRYWPRSWGARGLLWAWDDAALPALRVALCDPAWRVREMAAKVVARNLVGDALDDVAPLRADPVRRVRIAATRAVAILTARGA
jgi:HEAT repeat protein